MDDLDHSMHIAEVDWTSFYDDSEECGGGLLPALACPDNLSDLEDSENRSSVFSKDQQVVEQSPEVNGDRGESSAAGCSTGEICVQSSMRVTDNDTEEQVTSATWVDSEIDTDSPAGNILITEGVTEEVNEKTANRRQTDTSRVQCSQSSEETEYDRAVSDDLSSVSPRVEKERWFVTVNYSPARERTRSTVPSVKKKRRQKNHCRIGHRSCHGWGASLENDVQLKINSDENGFTGGRELGGFTTSNHDLVQNSGGGDRTAETKKCHSPKANVTEATVDQNKPDQGSSATTSHDPLTLIDPSQSMEPDESQDGADVSSSHSYDSECYLSAAESLEETKHPLMDNLPPQRSVSAMLQTESAGQMHFCHSSPCCKVAAASHDRYECTDAESALTFPSAGHQANKTPGDNSTCDIHTHSTELHVLSDSDTPGVQNDKTDLSASGSSSGDLLSCLPVPDVTVTTRCAADSPESYAKSLGLTRPVFAISAFWDEMEKLTINDILQLRVDRGKSPRGTQQKATTSVDGSLTRQSSPADTVQQDLSDGGLVELSDTADSDYFTQPDESKPDQSSCEVNTSDFEEEYWQFISSRNSSPDPHSESQERKRDSLSSAHEEEEDSTSSEGTETLVPWEDSVGQCLTRPRQMTKSKSMHNVQAFSKDDLTVTSGNDESRLFPSMHQSLEENMTLRVRDNLGILTPAPFLSSYDKAVLDGDDHTSFPEVSEYFYAKNDSSCVTDYALCTLKGDVSFSYHHDYLCGEDKPIPIFSCCHPTVRDITFPKLNYTFLSAQCEAEEEVGNIFPFRVWKGFPSVRRIPIQHRGSMWGRRSGAWLFPPDAEGKDPLIAALTEGEISATSSQVFRELAVQNILGTKQTRQKGILSTLKQSDMCLVCIAFASWVLTSSDPENADAWKAALLANVSALSAIQYLRQYVLKKKTPPQDDP